MYDLIGDVHGCADTLRALLAELGYADDGGGYRHPSRTVIFLGDFIDRGPRQREAVNIARAMVRRSTALAVMGNHELNALAYHTPEHLVTYSHDAPPVFLGHYWLKGEPALLAPNVACVDYSVAVRRRARGVSVGRRAAARSGALSEDGADRT